MLDTPGGPGLVTEPQLRRISCDASIARVLLGPDSIPVDFGRDKRLFTSQQRKALARRDGGCRFPGCHFPPALTDAHHVVSWLDGGESAIANAALLCRYHHRHMHELGWTLIPQDEVRGASGPLIFSGPRGQRLISEPGKHPTTTWWLPSGVPPD